MQEQFELPFLDVTRDMGIPREKDLIDMMEHEYKEPQRKKKDCPERKRPLSRVGRVAGHGV